MKLAESLSRIREVANSLPDDDPDKLEMLNTEGDFTKLMEWALVKRNDHLATAEKCRALSETYSGRQKSFEGKADKLKNIVSWIMTEANESKYSGPSATVSIKAIPAKPIVTDEDKIPDEYKRTSISIDKTKINEAVKNGQIIPGVSMDNGGQTLSIRSK